LHFVHGTVRNAKREHRTVVLPDYQGVGIGNRVSETVAQMVIEQKMRFISTTSHPAMMMHRSKSPKWRCHRFGHAAGQDSKLTTIKRSAGRVTAGFEYLGEKC
jgi:hypothetical protein